MAKVVSGNTLARSQPDPSGSGTVLIVGGSITGVSVALQLSELGLDVHLIEHAGGLGPQKSLSQKEF